MAPFPCGAWLMWCSVIILCVRVRSTVGAAAAHQAARTAGVGV